MKVLLVHPSGLMYTEVYLRLEPLGLELVAEACRKAGHEVRLLDLQVFRHHHYERVLRTWRPDVIGFSLNYLANIPEVVDLARLTRQRLPEALVLVGGHSASFTAGNTGSFTGANYQNCFSLLQSYAISSTVLAPRPIGQSRMSTSTP